MSRANLDQAVGRVLGDRYQLVSRIGSGASAEVYQATDLRLGRSVAVKQLRSDLTEDPRFAKLFRSEAQLAAKLSHPNILTVFDWSADSDGEDGGAYIVTELLSGGSLRTVLDMEGTISLPQAAFIGLQTAKGLAVAHDKGLVHRDIKPANLLFGGDGRVHIGDFGIARAVAQAAWTEPEGVLIGTARYAAPEQATAESIDGLVDVYSLTVCLIEAMTGEVPLVRDNALGTMLLRQAEDLPVDESFGVLAEPLAWAGLADRYERATAAELADALTVVCRTLPDPEPLTLVDLTDHIGGPVAVKPNVRISADGDLIIEGDDSDLEIPAVVEPKDEPLNDRAGDEHLTTSQRRRQRRALRWTLGLAVFALLGVGALFGGRMVAEWRRPVVETIALGLPSYPVADFSGMTVDEVKAAVDPNRWSVVVREEFVDGTKPNEILSQVPEPGSSMGPGGRVELVISLGPQRRVVPEMVGRTEAEVRDVIGSAGLVVGEVAESHDETADPGMVLEATIDGVPAQPGSEFLTGTVIDLLISSGPAPREVPPLTGLTVEQARISLADQDLLLASAEAYSESVDEGLVISVDPAAGSSIPRGGTVTVTMSLGLPFVTVPEVTGLAVPAAIEALKGVGLEVQINGTIGSAVLTTRPAAGEAVRLGSLVEIISSN